MLLKTLSSFILIFSFGLNAFADGLRCESLFGDVRAEFDWALLKGDALRVAVENHLRNFAKDEMTGMSANEIAELRSQAHQIGKKLFGVEARNDFYKKANGSLRARVIIEEINSMRRVRNELKRGSIDQAVEGLEFEFVQFEVNFLYMNTLRDEIETLLHRGESKSPKFKDRMKKLNEAEKYFGQQIFRYQAMQDMLEEVRKSVDPKQKRYAQKALSILQGKAKIEAAKQFLEYRKISLQEIEHYADFSSVAKDAMAHKVARVEFWTMFKMITLSGPIISMTKSLVYRLPSKMNLKWLGSVDTVIQPRQALSEALGIGHRQHLRDLYLESIESIVALDSPPEQYELLQSLNAISEKPDELLVTFARVPENQKVWLEILQYSKTLVDQENDFADHFHKRLEAAQQKAIAESPFPLYYNEAGVSTVGKVATGAVVAYFVVNRFLEVHPELAGKALGIGEQVLNLLQTLN